MELNIEDHISSEELKEIIVSEVRNNIRDNFRNEKNAERLLSNLSYKIVYDEIDKVIPNSRQLVINKTEQILKNIKSYSVFRDSDFSGKSLATKYMESAVIENKDLINQKVKDTIQNTDYSKTIWDKFEKLGESFIDNIYTITKLGRKD